VNLPRTGQTSCFDTSGFPVACDGTGQDGDLLAGGAWPVPRFVDNGDLTLTDNLTGLTWTKNGETPGNNLYTCSATSITVNWQAALNHIDCLNSRSYLGFTDWRLPNVNEIESLLNHEVADSTAWLVTQGFQNVWGAYWSSTTFSSTALPNGDYAFDINFLSGTVGISLKTATSYLPAVWSVRGETSGNTPLWKTGQIASFAGYDDGYFQQGKAAPQPRFTLQGECLTDRLIGLVWTQDGDRLNGQVGWQAALDYANSLDLCGSSDWRLPNRKELWSLLRAGSGDLLAWLESQGFRNVRSGGASSSEYYWSSTTYRYNPNSAWGFSMDGGLLQALSKSDQFNTAYVWAVRSGTLGGALLPTDTPMPTPTPKLSPTPQPSPTPLPRPVIDAVLPDQGDADVPGTLQIQGRNFKPGAQVQIGAGLILSSTVVSENMILAHLPAMPTGAYDLRVTSPGLICRRFPASLPACTDCLRSSGRCTYRCCSAKRPGRPQSVP
jgi:hypothetical protein